MFAEPVKPEVTEYPPAPPQDLTRKPGMSSVLHPLQASSASTNLYYEPLTEDYYSHASQERDASVWKLRECASGNSLQTISARVLRGLSQSLFQPLYHHWCWYARYHTMQNSRY